MGVRFVFKKIMNNFNSLKKWALSIKTNLLALYVASKNKNVSFLAKMFIFFVVAYALSPIDLIPDFIPIIGYLDDLILLPIGIWVAIKLIPNKIWLECKKNAEENETILKYSYGAAITIIIIWLFIFYYILSMFFCPINLKICK